MKFIDKGKIFVKSGKGGNGCVSFRRERCVPEGGPDGGDGGNGGSIVFLVDAQKETLIDFASAVHFFAKNGQSGGGARCFGKRGEDLIIHIPLGTQIWNETKDILFFDAISDGQRFVLCKGGKGGAGNARFVSSVNQTPYQATKGGDNEEMWVNLVLKIFADIGYVGFPNAGKSSLLHILTNSQTKIANYPFTTLSPELGALWDRDKKLVMADLPGIIKDAHQNKGLGFQFLGHIERCCGILHLIDVSWLNSKSSLQIMLDEIEKFSPELNKKSAIIGLNKIDLVSQEQLAEQIEQLAEFNLPIIPISCVTRENVNVLVKKLFAMKYPE